MGYSFSNEGSWRRLIDSHPSVGNLVGVNQQHKVEKSGEIGVRAFFKRKQI
jgi:hypothetical protein